MTVADLEQRMTFREYVEWCAHIRLDNQEQSGQKPAGGGWKSQKQALMAHMALVGKKAN